MKYNFTDDLRITLAKAREIAVQHQQGFVRSDHIVLALLQQPQFELQPLIDALGIDVRTAAAALEATLGAGDSTIKFGELPYETSAKDLLERAIAISEQQRHENVGTDHLFAAAADQNSVLAAILATRGLQRTDLLAIVDSTRSSRSRPWWKRG